MRKSSSDRFKQHTLRSPPHLRRSGLVDVRQRCSLRTNIRLSAGSAGRWNDPHRACVGRRRSNLRIEIGRADDPIGPRQLVARRIKLVTRSIASPCCARRLTVGTRLQALTRRTRLGIRLLWDLRRRLRRRSHHSAHQAQKGRKLNVSRHDDSILQLFRRTTGSAPDAFRVMPAGHLSQSPQKRKLAR